MHLVITKVELKPEAVADFREMFETRVPPFLGQASSWRGAELSIEEPSTAHIVGYWQDEGEMHDFLTKPEHAALIQELSVHFSGPPEVTFTEVATRIGGLAEAAAASE